MSTFRIGFRGSTTNEIVPWIVQHVGDATEVAVTMAGSGKDIAALARTGRTIRSWDTQVLSKLVVEGVFMAPAELPPPVALLFVKGYATANLPIKGMPVPSAMLADGIASLGSDYDRVCLAKALISSTFQGMLGYWKRGTGVEQLYAAYLKAHAGLAAWRGLPGHFIHTWGSVFEGDLDSELYGEVVVVDPPKVLKAGTKGDIYSAGYEGLNSILAQAAQTLPPWTEETYLRDIPRLWAAPYRRLIQFHATGCLPSVEAVAEALPPVTLTERWGHLKREDVAWVVDKL